ncbi:MAG: carboxypeptidase-like regulatory domain-containing protein, partial [Gemmatimonadota bacterium]
MFHFRSGSPGRWVRRAMLVVGVLLPSWAFAQGRSATVEGTVRDAANNRPLEGAQVIVVGTQTGAVTNAQGQYRLVIPNGTGTVQLRARTIGYAQQTKPVTLSGEVARVEFTLSQSSLQLDQVVVTGSGQATEVKKLGNTVAIVKPPENMPMTDVSNVLQGREPGLVGLPLGWAHRRGHQD